ncbi:MAG: dihydrodipicolinate synthase family protein, partial [Corallococcus sp.]|nr:dihydrodipicolinate synthase family protein [Corallococcus sp.]
MTEDKFKIFSAMITPYANGNVDYDCLSALLEKQKNSDIYGIVSLGTTAEPTLLNREEKKRITALTVSKLKGAKRIAVGIGTCSTTQTVENALTATDFGADLLLVVMPYYTKSTTYGLLKHFETISKATDLPLIPYNVPS